MSTGQVQRDTESPPDAPWTPTLLDVGDLGEFVGSGELEQMFGVSRQRVYQLTTSKGFPEPVAKLKAGAIWRTADVVRWAEEKGRTIHE